MFDRSTARPLCVGNGESCKRATDKGLEELTCPGPDTCRFGMGNCKPYGRLNVSIGDSDELGSFVFRTTGFNSIRTLAARLQYFAAASGGQLACMPLELKLRGKSTTQSHRSAIYYADLIVRSGMSLNTAIAQAKELSAQRQIAGFDQAALKMWPLARAMPMAALKTRPMRPQTSWKSFIQRKPSHRLRQQRQGNSEPAMPMVRIARMHKDRDPVICDL